MSLEVELLVAFAEKIDPVQKIIEIVNNFSNHERHGEIFSLLVYEKNHLTRLLSLKKGISSNQISQILQSYSGDTLEPEVRWEILRRYELNEVTGEPIECSHWIAIEIWGNQFYHSSLPPQINMIYCLGDQKPFLRKIYGEAVKFNIDSALQEIELLATLNIKTIQGVNVDFDESPETFFLCYQKDPDDFRKDLSLVHGQEANYKHLEKKDVLQAIDHCQNIRVLDTDSGLIVYHQDFVEGNLGEFYHELAKVATA